MIHQAMLPRGSVTGKARGGATEATPPRSRFHVG
jgi:hypothetical protein